MPLWLLPILQALLPSLAQAILNGLNSHPNAQSVEMQADIAKHEAVVNTLKA